MSQRQIYLIVFFFFSEHPSAPEVSPEKLIGNNGERVYPRCLVGSARPAADITWTLNGRDITTKATVKKTQSNNNVNCKSVLTIFKQNSHFELILVLV